MSTTITVKVKSRSSNANICIDKNEFIVKVKSPPHQGKANKELVELLAKFFHVPINDIKIKTGKSSTIKRIILPTGVDIKKHIGGKNG